MSMKLRVLGLCLALPAAACASAASAASVVTIEVPGVAAARATGLDDKGEVVGYGFSEDQAQSFIRKKDGSYIYRQAGVRIYSVSPKGVIAGQTDSPFQDFVDDRHGHLTPFVVEGLDDFLPVGVNDAGAVTGYGPVADHHLRAFVRNANGKIKLFDAPGAGTGVNQGTEAFSISKSGFICGVVIDGSGIRHGFLRDPAGTVTKFDPPGATRTSAITVDQDGTVVGSYRDASSVSHGYLRTADGTVTTYDAPGAGTAAGQGTTLAQVNKKGAMTGSVIDSNGVGHAFLRSRSGKVKQFDAPGAGTTFGFGTYGYYINAKSQIVGEAVDDQGIERFYIRLP